MSTDVSVKKSIVVNVPIAHAFEVFTKRFDLWWPKTHKIGKAEMKDAVLEPREGGRWYERGVDGTECEWGTVLTYMPPSQALPAKVAVSWNLNGQYAYDPDPAKASRVEVTFHDEGGKTRVELVHSGFERQVEGEAVKQSVGSEGGWPGIMDLFKKAAEE